MVCLCAEAEGGEGLRQGRLGGAEVDDHEGLAVAAQGRLEEVGEGAVPEGHVVGLFGDGLEDVGQGGERLIDVLRLGQGRPSHAAVSSLFDVAKRREGKVRRDMGDDRKRRNGVGE